MPSHKPLSKTRQAACAILLSLLIAGCERSAEAPAEPTTASRDVAKPEVTSEPSRTLAAIEQASMFDIASVPVSDAPLGDFPYFTLPAGYTTEEGRNTETKDFARFPFWVKGQPVWVEGKFYLANFDPEKGKSMSEYEVKKNFEAMITRLGGVKVSEEPIPGDTVESWGDEIQRGFSRGLGAVYNPTTTYVIHRNDGNVWVHLVTSSAQGWYIVGQEKAFQPTATLLPASEPSRTLAAIEQASMFDIASVPVSNVPLGDFPYFTLPAGYTTEGRDTETKDFARFPFWVKGQPVWVEGKFYLANFVPEEGKPMSEYEVKKNFEALITRLGGVKVSEEPIPGDTVKSWGDEIQLGFNGGLGDVYNNPTTTYVIHRNDGNVWVHLVTDSAQGWYIVGQEKAFQPTATLLPASELKRQLDDAGKVALQVNFATDKTDLLPDSQPQIDQVVQLLNEDPTLKLAVNGHTDDSGDVTHNQQLSEGRAQSVAAALTAKGIDPSRLNAKGFGQDQPVADNATAAGKAKNRRVELVKQ